MVLANGSRSIETGNNDEVKVGIETCINEIMPAFPLAACQEADPLANRSYT